MNAVFMFLANAPGRLARIGAGISLIVLADYAIKNKTWRWLVGVIGLIPLFAGLLDVCVFGPLFKLPFEGDELRAELKAREVRLAEPLGSEPPNTG